MRLLTGQKILSGIIGVSFLLMLGFMITEPIRPIFIVEVGASPMQLGLIMALYPFISILIRIPVSALSVKIGRWRLILFSIIVSAFTAVAYGYVDNPLLFFPIVSIAALSWPIYSPIATLIVTNESSPRSRGVFMGVYYTSVGAALFVGPLLGSIFTRFIELRQLFLLSAAFPLFALIVFFFTIDLSDGNHRFERSNGERSTGLWDRLSRLFKVKNLIALCSARVAFATLLGVFNTMFPLYAKSELGLTPSLISLLFAFGGITNVLIRIPAGRLSDRIGRRKPFLLAHGSGIFVFLLFAFTKNLYSLALLMAVYGLGWGMRLAPSTALLSESVTSEDRSLAFAIFDTMWDVGFTIGAVIVGFTSVIFSLPRMMLICTPILIISLIIFLILSSEVDYHE
jgi:MFS family permease